MEVLDRGNKAGVIICVKTQCAHGAVNDVYETGRLLTKIGCVLTADMTVECIIAKLMYLLGKGYSSERIKALMKKNLRGELTEVRLKEKYSFNNSHMVMAIANYLKADDFADIKEIHASITPVLVNSVIQSGNIKLLKKLKHEGADFNSCDYLGRSPLHVICNSKGNLETAKYLLKQTIDLDQLDSKARSPLYLSIESDNFEVAELLCSHGARCFAGKERLAKILCQAGFDNHFKKIELLHKCDVDLNIADYDKRNIGHLAAAESNFEILRFLAKQTSFDFDATDRWGRKTLDDCTDEKVIQEINTLVASRKPKD